MSKLFRIDSAEDGSGIVLEWTPGFYPYRLSFDFEVAPPATGPSLSLPSLGMVRLFSSSSSDCFSGAPATDRISLSLPGGCGASL